jgi:hypothetical protein
MQSVLTDDAAPSSDPKRIKQWVGSSDALLKDDPAAILGLTWPLARNFRRLSKATPTALPLSLHEGRSGDAGEK